MFGSRVNIRSYDTWKFTSSSIITNHKSYLDQINWEYSPNYTIYKYKDHCYYTQKTKISFDIQCFEVQRIAILNNLAIFKRVRSKKDCMLELANIETWKCTAPWNPIPAEEKGIALFTWDRRYTSLSRFSIKKYIHAP